MTSASPAPTTPRPCEAKARELGATVHAATPEDAVAFGDVVLLAVPWSRKEDAIPDAGPYDDKIVIDAMNPYTEDFEIEDLGDRTASEITETLVPGARLVKAFNTIHYRRLATEGKPKGTPRAGLLSSWPATTPRPRRSWPS